MPDIDPVNSAYDHLIYVRSIEACNMHCEHCFIPNNPKRMTMDDIHLMPATVRNIAKPGDQVLLQWHGGEPTLMGVDFYKKAITFLNDSLPEFTIHHGIQTNLLNYTPEWGDLFKTHFGDTLGVSWDYKIRLLNRSKPESNEDYEKIFWANMDALINDGLVPTLVVTTTKLFFAEYINPNRFYDMLVDRGIRSVHFERLTRTGYADVNWDKIGLTNFEYSRYMGLFSTAYARRFKRSDDLNQRLHISPFDGLYGSVSNLMEGNSNGGYGCWSGSCDSSFHTIDKTGYQKGCTALTAESNNRNAVAETIINIQDLQEARTKRTETCNECKYRPICSSGCMANEKLDVSGECSGAFHLFKTIETDIIRNGQLVF
ncbi:MAG: SPASM domain-containing protein [Pseudomonadales bacterium]